jgi:hypothetical protein
MNVLDQTSHKRDLKYSLALLLYITWCKRKTKDLGCLVNSEKKSIPDVMWIIDKKAKMRNTLYLPDNDHFVYEIEFVQDKQKYRTKEQVLWDLWILNKWIWNLLNKLT